MYTLPNILYISVLCLCVSFTICDQNLTNIHEKGNSTTLNVKGATNSSNLDVKKSNQTLPSELSLNSKSSNSSFKNSVITEGGVISSTLGTHTGREHVIEPPAVNHSSNSSVDLLNSSKNGSTNIQYKPVKEDVLEHAFPPEHDKNKLSVPKKGVSDPPPDDSANNTIDLNPNFPNSKANVSRLVNKTILNTKSPIANVSSIKNKTIIYKKPIFTESDSDYINLNDPIYNEENTINIDQIDPLAEKKNNRSDYIVPIVAVILSVPLVAILFSVLYKRGADWWQHRNYKRMDFLIEGMYHN